MPYSDYSGSSLASSYGVVSSSQRPDKPLIVKCTFDRSMRRITFSSAQNCSFELLRTRVEQCFSLYASSFTVNYKDDDGEVTDITSDDDLTEAIQYFHLGDDIAPISSNASVYSGRSSGSSSSRKITLRVDVRVDYDGPSLSDTASLTSLEEDVERRRQNGEGSGILRQDELRGFGHDPNEDDEETRTIASRPTIAAPLNVNANNARGQNIYLPRAPVAASGPNSIGLSGKSISNAGSSTNTDFLPLLRPSRMPSQQTLIPQPEEIPRLTEPHVAKPTNKDISPDTTDVFQRLKLAEVAEGIPGAGIDVTAGGNKTPIKLGGGMAQWLKEQSAQMVQSVLGGVPTAPSTQAPSVVGHGQLTDQQSISLSSSDDHVMVDNHQAYQPEPADFEELPGSLELELELEQNKRGSYYYTYTGSVISQSLDDRNSGGLSRQPTASSSRSIPYHQRRAARASRMTEDVMEEEDGEIGTLEQESVIHGDEFLQYLPPSRSQDTLVGPNPAELTECSSCGVMLDTFRYVCATCGPRAPRGLADATASLPLDVDPTSKGKGRADTGPLSTSPRPPFPTPPGSSSTGSSAVGELPPFPMSPPYSPPQPLYDRAHSHGHLHSRSTQLSPHPPPPHNPYTPDRSPVSTPAHPPSSPSGGSIWSMIESGSVPLVKPHLNTSSPSISKPLPQIPGSLPTTHTYPPPPPPSHSPASSWSARNVFNRESPFADPPQLQPPPPPPPPQQLQLPQVQQLQQQPSPVISPRSPRQGSGSQTSDSSPSIQEGFELCTDCMETAGIEHASGSVSANPFASPINGSTPGIAANAGPGSYQESVSSSPRNRGVYTGGAPGRAGSTSSLDSEDARSWKRSVPWKKGQLRHAFKEKVWTPSGWTDVEHDDISKCTTCGSDLTTERFKCATCLDMVVCRGCYSQIHEIHPIHAFLTVPERKDSSSSTPESEEPGERSLLHDGLKCSHCLMEIVGARFHCAICPSVDICSNCESAGLPGNLTSPDGGHDSSHIMIKVPFPLTSSEVDMASRKALLLWRGRDGPNVAFNRLNGANDANINGALEHDPYADTVIGGGGAPNSDGLQSGMQRMDHGMYCNGCGLRIIGVRYQCAGCPSSDGQGYSLCVTCEARSYQLHDAMHCFFKIPRPLDRKIQEEDALLPPLYILAAGESLDEMPPGTSANDPRAYLQTIVHRVALCDRCIQRITGEWYHCAYCAKDLCDACEAMDSHDASHLFVVFKSVVDMSILRTLTDVENPQASRPLIGYPVYTQSL